MDTSTSKGFNSLVAKDDTMKTIDVVLIFAACALLCAIVVISDYEEGENMNRVTLDVVEATVLPTPQPAAANTSEHEELIVSQPIPLTPLENLTIYLANDSIDEREYNISGEYVCIDFAIDLAHALADAGYDAGCVAKTAKWHCVGQGHVINWVALPNETVYIEPQNDYIMTPDEYLATVNLSNFVVREITTEHAERLRTDMRRWG